MTQNKLERWYIEVKSDTLQTAISEEEGSVKDHILSDCLSVSCVDKDGTALGERPLIEIDSYLKDRIYERRKNKGFVYNLFRQIGNGPIQLYFEQVAPERQVLFKRPVDRRRKPVIRGTSLLRRHQRLEKKVFKGVH